MIELTEKQGEQIAELWKKHGGFGKAMLAQPGNIVDGRYTKIKIGILQIFCLIFFFGHIKNRTTKWNRCLLN